jgi:hypothetical protein
VNAIIHAYRAGQSLRQIARQRGTGTTAVWRALHRHNEPRRPRGQPPSQPTQAALARDAAVLRAYRAGHSLDAISRFLRIGKTTAWAILVRHNEPRRHGAKLEN